MRYTTRVSMKCRTRIITYVEEGQRVFTVGFVYYDDSFSPVFAINKEGSPHMGRIEEIEEYHPELLPLLDSPILDRDNYLKVYNHD